MSFRTHVIQSEAKDLECINVDVIHTPLSPLSRGEEIINHKLKNHLRRR